GAELPGTPDRRVEGGEYADLPHGKAVPGEQDREQAPGEPVVEVVDPAGLGAGRQGRVGAGGRTGPLAGAPVPAPGAGVPRGGRRRGWRPHAGRTGGSP